VAPDYPYAKIPEHKTKSIVRKTGGSERPENAHRRYEYLD